MWWHNYEYRDTRRHMRYASGGGWWATDERKSGATILARDDDSTYRLTPEQLKEVDDELDAQWREELERAHGDTSKALKACLARQRVTFAEKARKWGRVHEQPRCTA